MMEKNKKKKKKKERRRAELVFSSSSFLTMRRSNPRAIFYITIAMGFIYKSFTSVRGLHLFTVFFDFLFCTFSECYRSISNGGKVLLP